jgi:putative transposase
LRVGFARVGLAALSVFMPKRLRRHYGQRHLHFLTFCCYHRRPYLETVRARNLFIKVLGEVRTKFKFLLVGYVVMPDHVHLLLSEPANATISDVLQVLKQRISQKMRARGKCLSRKQLQLKFVDADEAPRFWQRRFYDFNVWSHEKKIEKLHYMHANPVRQRLVEHPKDWPWSSFSFYAKDEPGLIGIDPVD